MIAIADIRRTGWKLNTFPLLLQDYSLFCPYAYRLPSGALLAKDLAVEYKYLSESSEWFYIARKKAEEVIGLGTAFKTGTMDGKFLCDKFWVRKELFTICFPTFESWYGTFSLTVGPGIVLRQCLFERS